MGKLRLAITAASLLLLCITFLSIVQADDGNTYKVADAEALNIRSAPSANADIIGVLKKNDKVTVFQKQDGWAQTYYEGEAGWVSTHYLSSLEQNTADDAIAAFASGKSKIGEYHSIKQPLAGALEDYTVVLDPGHGGADPGAAGIDGTLEKDLTMTTADYAAKKLRDAGANVILTRSDDSYVSLEKRVRISNKHNTDAFISLHYNAYPVENVHGFSTHYDTDGADKALAADMQSALKQTMDLDSRGIKQNGYHVLDDNQDLAVLIELGFLTSPSDTKAIKTDAHQKKVGEGIVNGLKRHFEE
ncbi:hypothetical protein GCM10028778_24150 [Barrientosiimonas marina]|uniref:N-acetylmuramoyl-L-alanine amidase n=1 Tax=Lentibacillus kimchii TaxID=1542911 RepID=A0ABW2UXE3_9BACI